MYVCYWHCEIYFPIFVGVAQNIYAVEIDVVAFSLAVFPSSTTFVQIHVDYTNAERKRTSMKKKHRLKVCIAFDCAGAIYRDDKCCLSV